MTIFQLSPCSLAAARRPTHFREGQLTRARDARRNYPDTGPEPTRPYLSLPLCTKKFSAQKATPIAHPNYQEGPSGNTCGQVTQHAATSPPQPPPEPSRRHLVPATAARAWHNALPGQVSVLRCAEKRFPPGLHTNDRCVTLTAAGDEWLLFWAVVNRRGWSESPTRSKNMFTTRGPGQRV